nr:MAG TPA: hypothetical protein [Caudoviricetes sp.]
MHLLRRLLNYVIRASIRLVLHHLIKMRMIFMVIQLTCWMHQLVIPHGHTVLLHHTLISTILWRLNNMKYLLIGLTLIFTVCKLLKLISWSWWLVFTPAIIYVVILLLLFLIMTIGYIIDGK